MRSPAPCAGNAMIYVLIVIALFAAITFIVARGTTTSEQGAVNLDKANVYANQIIQVSNQVKQGVDEMIYSGSTIDELDFCLPSDACYAAGPTNVHKVFHTDGGGIAVPRLPTEAAHEVDANPPPGFYIGRFNNVEWTPTAGHDVILVAHQIAKSVCQKIDEILTGSSTIPALDQTPAKYLIDASRHTGGTADLTAANCAGCASMPALCVSNPAGTMWTYYNIIEQQ